MPSASRLPTAARSSKRSGGDDIPLAKRTVSPALQRKPRWRLALVAAGSTVLAAAALVVVFPQPLRRLLTPPVKCGLLAGTFRANLLDQGKIREEIMTIEMLKYSNRIYIINSVKKWREAVLIPH